MTSRSQPKRVLLGALLLLGAASCSKKEEQPNLADAKAPSTDITRELKKGEGIDLVFAIKQQDINADGSRILQVRGTYYDKEVGLIVVLGPKWETVAPDPKSKFAFHTGTVEYRTIGDPSNILLSVLDDLYSSGLHPQAMRAETKFAGTSLQGDPTDLVKGEVRIKLSYESTDPER